MRQFQRVMWIGVLASAGVVGGVWTSWGPQSEASPPVPAAPSKKVVVTARVEAAQSSPELRFSGVVRAHRRAELGFAVAGRVAARSVDVGDRVRRGQTLARLDRDGFEHQVAEAHAALTQVDAQLRLGQREDARARALARQGALSQAELDQAAHGAAIQAAAREGAEVRLAEARRLHGDTVLRAPFDGTVVEVQVERGEFAGPGQPLVVLAGDEQEVEVQVPETVLPRVRPGATVRLELPLSGERRLEGTVDSVSHGGAQPGQLFPVVIGLGAVEGLLPGMAADLLVPAEAVDGVEVPIDAVIDAGSGRTVVFVLHEGRAVRREIHVDAIRGDRAFVREGLDPGTEVVTGGHFGLVAGEPVEVRP